MQIGVDGPVLRVERDTHIHVLPPSATAAAHFLYHALPFFLLCLFALTTGGRELIMDQHFAAGYIPTRPKEGKMKSRCVIVVGLAMLACLSAQAGNIVVYVGYADNLRPSGFFPTPWLGGAGIVSETPVGQNLDTGAVRIDNSTGAAITISGMAVTLGGGQVFSIWSPLVIPDGGIGIFTQTASYNFDSSDFGLFGAGPVNVDAAHPLGGCTNPANATEVANCLAYQPLVVFNLDGTPASYRDSGHVLDTVGYDLINLPRPSGDGNESINWNLIGTTPTRGGGGSAPEPAAVLLMGPALLALGLFRWRKQSQ
jgi:hypothetical protein